MTYIIRIIISVSIILLLRSFTIPQSRTYTPGTYNPNARGLGVCRGSNSLWTRTLTCTQGLASLNKWSAQCQGLRRRQHSTEYKGHTPSPRIEIKIPDPPGIELGPPRRARLEGRDSTDYATLTDCLNNEYSKKVLKNC